ncbi:MAG: prepilin-type N-terminal cleavage/methylation domain-containing protein [Leptolyngbyaceae cyanobacterium CRU_2_3]|nr:prepilin-type N-terminal cleavage/methylation domain-containing protein [Leptolyngbyaceae cyanobacterium CRU_2_3]
MLGSTSRLQRWLHSMSQAIAQTQSGDRSTLPQTQQPDPPGVTLIECLVAILVIGLTVSLITPPIFIAVATRAQIGEQNRLSKLPKVRSIEFG